MTARPPTLQFSCTFHDSNLKNGGFFGRTYLSKTMELRQSSTVLGRFDCDAEDFVYFSYNGNTATKEKDAVRIVVELVVRWEERGGLQKTAAIGFTTLQVFADNQKGKVRATVEQGTPRFIGHFESGKTSNFVAEFIWECEKMRPEEFKYLNELLEPNCFVGQHEVIPGLKDEKIPPARSQPGQNFQQIALKPMEKRTIYLHNLYYQTHKNFEKKFQMFLVHRFCKQNGFEKQSREAIQAQSQIAVQNRCICVFVNNCWTNLDEHTIFLEPPNENAICKSKTQTFSFSNYYVHNMIGLNFKVEYTASLPSVPGSRSRDSKATVVVAYGTFLPRLSGASVDEQNIDFFCEMGPAIAATEDIVWTEDPAYKSGVQVRIAGKFSTSQNAGVLNQQVVSLPTLEGEAPKVDPGFSLDNDAYKAPGIKPPPALGPSGGKAI